MIVWRGWGVIVAVVVFACCLGANLLANAFGGAGYWDSHSWPLASALIIAGGLIVAIDLFLSKAPARTLTDNQGGEQVLVRKRNDFFFLAMKWWGAIMAGLGGLVLITHFVPGKG
jgi:hypothetical protein